MQVNATSAAVEPPPVLFAGLPVSSWAFAIRIWLAVLAALYASFWLELEAPSTAAITVAILALPTRGQGMEKAGFRLFATVIGVVAAIAIAGGFAQTDGLLLTVLGAWVGLCVYAAGMLDGNRAYAAALCCITVALVAIAQIDSPEQVFNAGVMRGSAIVIGVLAIALVNNILAAPDYHPVVAARLDALHRRVMSYIARVIPGEATSGATAGPLLHDIAALRPATASLATESVCGTERSAAARTAIVDLVAGMFFARALAALPADREDDASGLMTICRTWVRRELLRNDADVDRSLKAVRMGTQPAREWRAPLYRSRRIAAEAGVRAAIHFALASVFFAMAGWPATETCLSLFAVIIGLACTAPDPRLVAALAIVAAPIACLLAGILKYFVLDTVSAFQLLAIGLAPFIIALALLITLPNPILSSLGRLTMVFTLAVLAPANPQSYDPETFLVTSLFICLSAILAWVAHLLVPPLSNDRRLRQLLSEAHRDLGRLDVRRHPDFAPEEAMFRIAARIEQIVTIGGASPSNHRALDEAMRCFDQAGALRLSGAELTKLAGGPLADAVDAAQTSLAQRNADAMLASAGALREAALRHHQPADAACAALVLASVVFTPARSATGSIDRGEP